MKLDIDEHFAYINLRSIRKQRRMNRIGGQIGYKLKSDASSEYALLLCQSLKTLG